MAKWSKSAEWMMITQNDLKFSLRRILLGHVGHENAIKLDAILVTISLKDKRNVRRSIESLIEEDEFPVCSVTDEEPKGYFFPASVEEASKYALKLHDQAISILHRGSHIEQITSRWYERARQLEMV